MTELAVFPSGSRWVLLQDACEVGRFLTQAEALAAAAAAVRGAAGPRYALISEASGEWRETLLN